MSDLESEAQLDVTDRDVSVKTDEKAVRKGSGDFEVQPARRVYNSTLVRFVNKIRCWTHCADSEQRLNSGWLDMVSI